MRIAYFDLIAGASGDMILAAMLDAGLPLEALLEGLADLNLHGYEISHSQTMKNGFRAGQVDVIVNDRATERHLEDILDLVNRSHLPEIIKTQTTGIFTRMGQIEANIHGVELEKVHLHELGGIDTIIDVTGALIGMMSLDIQMVYCSPFPLGRGFVQGSHGHIPLPSPATAALLKGFPIKSSDIDKELVTPTGAAILTAISTGFGAIPNMVIRKVGYGAGKRDLPIPNLIRLFIGENDVETGILLETLTVLETNIDDLNPQIYDFLLERLFQHGALDVSLTPIHMKKNRPAIQVSVYCKPGDAQDLQSIVFAETSTLGIRQFQVERYALPRTFRTVETPYGTVRVKSAEYMSGKQRGMPEFEDCRLLAKKHGVPVIAVYKAALIQCE